MVAPVVPATQEAETGEWHKPGRWSVQWAKIMPLHSSLGNRARLCLKKKKSCYKDYLNENIWDTEDKERNLTRTYFV